MACLTMWLFGDELREGAEGRAVDMQWYWWLVIVGSAVCFFAGYCCLVVAGREDDRCDGYQPRDPGPTTAPKGGTGETRC